MKNIYFMLNIKNIKRAIIFVIGITIFLIGLALLFLPGPGILIIIVGLVILAVEFIWARKMLKRIKFTLNNSRKH